MVDRLFRFFHREVNGLHEAAFVLASFALLSQILALVRDKLLAHSFGAGVDLDLYYAAFRIPDFLFITIGSLVSLSVLIPFFAKNTIESEGQSKRFLDSVFSVYSLLILAVSLIVFFLIPTIVKSAFPGFVGQSHDTLVVLTRILLLSPLFLGISNIFGTITQANNRFLVYALSPVVYNCGIILGIFVLVPHYGLNGLVLGVVLGAILHALIQVPAVFRLRLLPTITFKIDWANIRRVAVQSVPRTVTLSTTHLALLVLLSMASLMPAGSISVFNFAWNLGSVPLSIIGVSYSMAAFPALSRYFASGEKQKFIEKIVVGLNHIVFWSIPATVVFIVLRAHIVRVVLGSGAFDWGDTRLTAAVLALFVVSLLAQAISLFLIRSFYAVGKTAKPLYINIISGVSIVFFGVVAVKLFESWPAYRFFFESLLRVPDVSGSVVTMLALGFSLGTILNATLLWFFFSRSFGEFARGVWSALFQSAGASIIMGFVIFISLRFFDNFFSLEHFSGVFFQALFSALIGLAVWVGVLRLLGSRELETIWKTLHVKFWRTTVVGPDPEITN